MGRKSLKEERSRDILDAFWRVVEKKGLDAASLEDIAAEAGMQRRTIRHYMGNRDDLVGAGIAMLFDMQMASQAELPPDMPAKERVRTIIRWLFSDHYLQAAVNRKSQGLVSSVNRSTAVRDGLKTLYDNLAANLDNELHQAWPDMAGAQRDSLVYMILCLAFGNRHMRGFGFDHKDSKALRQHILSLLPD